MQQLLVTPSASTRSETVVRSCPPERSFPPGPLDAGLGCDAVSGRGRRCTCGGPVRLGCRAGAEVS